MNTDNTRANHVQRKSMTTEVSDRASDEARDPAEQQLANEQLQRDRNATKAVDSKVKNHKPEIT